jgi:hypothetical protein
MASSPRDVVRMHATGAADSGRAGFGGPPKRPGHLTQAGAAVIHARRQPRNRSMDAANLRGRAGNRRSQRHERGVRVLRPALHAHVACLRRMRRRANRLTRSQVGMSERRAGQRPKGQARCRNHREDSLPHRLAPSVKDACLRFCTPSGAVRQPSAPRTARHPVHCRHGWRTSCTRGANAALVHFGAQPALTTRGAAGLLSTNPERPRRFEHGCRAAHRRFRRHRHRDLAAASAPLRVSESRRISDRTGTVRHHYAARASRGSTLRSVDHVRCSVGCVSAVGGRGCESDQLREDPTRPDRSRRPR